MLWTVWHACCEHADTVHTMHKQKNEIVLETKISVMSQTLTPSSAGVWAKLALSKFLHLSCKAKYAFQCTSFNMIKSSHGIALSLLPDSKMSTLRSTDVRYECDEKERRLISDHRPAPHRDTPSTNFITSTRVHARWCFLLIPPFAVGTVTILSCEGWLDGSAFFGLNSCLGSVVPTTGHCFSFPDSEADYEKDTNPQKEKNKEDYYMPL